MNKYIVIIISFMIHRAPKNYTEGLVFLPYMYTEFEH